MSRPIVPRSRAWPRFAVLAAVGVAVAGCADSARFDANPFADRKAAAPEVTGSIATRAPTHRVESQPLPAPPTRSGIASGGQGLGAYRPAEHAVVATASIPQHRPEPAQPQGHWTWDGGSPVVVERGQSLENIAHKYGVPASAILQTNGLASAASVKPGRRLVIPRYVVGEVRHEPARVEPARIEQPRVAAAPAPARPASTGDIHIVQPGESLMGIAHRHGVSLSELARINNIQPYTKVAIGDRLTIPAGHHARMPERVAATPPAPRREARLEPRHEVRPAPAKAAVQPHRAPKIDSVGSVPVETARVATPEPVVAPENPVKKAEAVAAAHVPSFRWPVTGHVIEAFGARSNGTSNDGINLAVPEGTPIRAAEDGVVAYSGNELKGYGNLVLIRHADNYVSAYANASELLVKRGDSVRRGQVIARSGQTGNVTSPQLHFEIRKGSTPVDPRKLLASK
jgi:murein DD-endopeptidase MepM/ murein hydrolase activator NlpD